MTRFVDPLPGWERVGVTWCRTRGDVRMELGRDLNPESALIEWHLVVWRGYDRANPIVEEWTGQDLRSATMFADEVAA